MRKRNIALAFVLLAVLLAVALTCLQLEGGQQPDQTLVGSLRITEVCAKNDTVLPNNAGRYPDYVELYNEGDDINLSGFCFSDGKTSSKLLEDILLHSGEYRVIFLGDTDMGLSLSAIGGDCLQLLDPQGHPVCEVNTAPMRSDQAMVWLDSAYRVVSTPSPGFPNDAEGVQAFQVGFEETSPKLVISELLAQNVCAMPGADGLFPDYAELWNLSGETVNLSSFWLSDDPENRFAYRLPEGSLVPGEYLVVCCDSENRVDGDGTIHTNFSLSYGETLCLTNAQGCYQTLPVDYPGADVSLAWTEAEAYEPQSPSLGYANDEAGQYAFARSRINPSSALVVSEVLLSGADVPYEGAFRDVVELMNVSDGPVSTEGWYLSDGSDPYAYPIPVQTLEPGACLAIVCSPQTTGFSLSRGETVYLMAPDRFFAFPAQCTVSQGQSLCLLDMAEGSFVFSDSSPGYASVSEYRKASASGVLRISEVMSANTQYLVGPYGKTSDWLELYNPGSESVNLADFCLSNSAGDLYEQPLPEVTVEPGEYCVLLLSNSQVSHLKGYSVVPMTVSSQGETLYLSKDGLVEDWVNVPPLGTDTAYGRPGSDMDFSLLEVPTPGEANSGPAQRCAVPTALTAQGVYDDIEYLDVVLEGQGQLYYTTDGSIPGENATLYTGPIRLTASTALRVVSREAGKVDSIPLDLSYIINENDQLPVVALISEPEGLWSDESGIYAMGPNAASFYPYFGANFHKDWERRASIALFELDGTGFSEPCGIKIFGAYSRGEDKKSLAVFFRDAYGCSRLDYPLFGGEGLDCYENFILRNSGQDADMGRMRNVLITSIAADYTNMPVQKYRPVVVYINGEYFGVHYIREKANEQYVAGNCNVPVEDVTLCEGNGTGCKEYQDLVRYALHHNMTLDKHYEYMCSQMDMEVYMDYIISQIWIANVDNSNVKFYKAEGQKWQWVLYDTDLSMFQTEFNSVADHLNPAGTGGWGSTDTKTSLINALLRNPKFKEAFLRRFGWHMSTVWTKENINNRIDEIVGMIGQDMVKDCKRWDTSYRLWEQHVDAIRRFARNRNRYLIGYIQHYFDLSTYEMRQYGFPV